MRPRSEADVLRDVRELLEARADVRAWRCPSGIVKVRRRAMHLAPAGTADFVGVLRGLEAALDALATEQKPERVARAVLRAFFDDERGFVDMTSDATRRRATAAAATEAA